MKLKQIAPIILVFFIAGILMVPVFAAPVVAAAKTGNGAPSGAHFNLNIIGVPKEKNGDMTGAGNVIFVNLVGKTRIGLECGDSFSVLDKDGTDGSATLQLMDPYPGGSVEAVYKIYVRVLGKPGGSMTMTTGFIDEFGNEWLSLESVTLTRNKGKSTFSDKTLELTTIFVDITDDGVDNPVRYNLFDNELWSYFWDYNNEGLKLLQMRIYVE